MMVSPFRSTISGQTEFGLQAGHRGRISEASKWDASTCFRIAETAFLLGLSRKGVRVADKQRVIFKEIINPFFSYTRCLLNLEKNFVKEAHLWFGNTCNLC